MVIWSLVHEMRISIIFPFVFLLIRINWRLSTILAIALTFISFGLMTSIPSEFNTPVSTNYFVTLHYLSMFIIGALLAINREFLISSIVNSKKNIFFYH